MAKHYVNNGDLYAALVVYNQKKQANTGEVPIPDYVGRCILLICEKLSLKPNFFGYTYRDEMVGDAIENCVRAVDNFDPARGKNPFAYLTQVAYNAMISRIVREKKQGYIKHKNLEHLLTQGIDIQIEEIESVRIDYSNERSRVSGREASYQVISNFEDGLKKKSK